MNSHQEDSLLLVDRIKQALATPRSTTTEHARILADISRLQLAVETPLETIYRIGHQTWQNACVRIALELGIFDTLVAKGVDSVGVQELASPHGADFVLLVRIMRVVVALGLCDEAGVNEYKANSKTKIMTTPQGISSFKSWFDIFTPAAAKLPEYMRSQNYQNPTESTNSAFVYATGSEFWDHLNKTPIHSETFNDFMATRREGKPSWYDIYPVDRELLSSSSNAETNPEEGRDVLLVDVGGNRGHDLVKLRTKYPKLGGRLILQDLPDVLAHAFLDSEDMAIEAMPHDFFQPQPVRHARAYHFRAIFHDWPDVSCRQILSHTAAAMERDYSKLLISELVLPDAETALFPATLDIQMMGLHAGMERSEKQWRTLLDSAGLEIVKIWQEVKGGEAVIEAALKN
ncbi:MAG: hypothetical protein LQ349_000642 [Xanthoria aureola]|nr:MAG: hypothetical protein LQ349_000642 [Xanthoria aureola]